MAAVTIAFVIVALADKGDDPAAVLLVLMVMVPACAVVWTSFAIFSQSITRNPTLDDAERRRARAYLWFLAFPPIGATLYYVKHGSDRIPPQQNPSLSFLGR